MNTLAEYMEKYGKNYSEHARETIYELFDSDIPVDIVLQIKSKLNLLPLENNVYNRFIEKLDEHDFLHGRVLEVGCGFYPALAEKIVETHDVEITAIDPNLVIDSEDKINLIKGLFPTNVDIEKYDSIISLLPCEATIPIIVESFKYKKPYLMVLCKCTHFDFINPYYFNYYYLWERYVMDCADKYKNEQDQLAYDKLERENGDSLSLIYKRI